MKFLSRMRLIYQISLIGLSALTIFVIVGGVLFVADAQRQSAENSADSALQDRLLVDDIAKEFLNARRREKDFLLRLDEKYVTDHAETVAAVHDGLEQLSANPKLAPFETEIGSILTSFDAYADKFSKIVNLQRDIGLTEEGGLLGSLRSSVHDVEEALATYNADNLTVIMLMMRRHEKDFLARIDPKYVDSIDARLAEFGPALAATSSIPDDEKKKITGLMSSYVSDFKALAEKIL
ncbi:MAG TPA: methyl-accepting chemotaxis protein, partial [Thalassospira lucentensis]|nr:methyl-accepting chemotaxis protein [Thalassospira lucentensis]